MIFTSLFSTETLLYLTAVVTGIITLLYLLKLRKRRVEVPFSPIWRNVLSKNSELESWRKYLRRIFSWLFFLLIAAFVIVAIYDPHAKNEATNSRHLLVLLDNSASMSSTDVSGSVNRFELGRKKISTFLKSLDTQDQVMLATFNEVVQPQTPFISDTSLIEATLNQLQPTATTTNFSNAFSFAADTLQNMEHAELIIVTDGASPTFTKILESHPFDYSDESTSSNLDKGSAEEKRNNDSNEKNRDSLGNSAKNKTTQKKIDNNKTSQLTYGERLKDVAIRFIGVGESNDNLSITAFSARRYLANRLDFELLVQVQSYFNREIDAAIDLFSDGKLVDTKKIHLTPKGQYQQFYPSQAVSGERLEARIRITTNDAHDIFPVDNVAYSILPKIKIDDVLLVTNGNLYLEGPLLLNPNIRLKRITPSQYQKMSEEERTHYPIIILDNVDASTPPTSNTLYINLIGDHSPWSLSNKTIADPIIARAKKTHPLLRWMSLQDLNIRTAKRSRVGRDDVVVGAAVDGTPMIIARQEAQRRLIGLTFDIRDSDFPLRVSFPVFMINVLDWFSDDANNISQSYHTGESWKIPVPKEVNEVEVILPSSGGNPNQRDKRKRERFPVFEHYAYLYGATEGFYDIYGITTPKDKRTNNQQHETGFHLVIAANLEDRAESDVQPHKLELPQRSENNDKELLVARQMPWIWLVITAFILLIIEWFTYNRRVTE